MDVTTYWGLYYMIGYLYALMSFIAMIAFSIRLLFTWVGRAIV